MKLRIAALAGFLLVLGATARSEPYTLFIYESPEQLALRSASGDAAAYWNAYDAFGKELAAAGVLRGGSALTTGAAVALLGGDEDAPASPVARSGRPLGGYFQIDVATDAEAIAWAAKLPAAGSGLVEVRAGYPVPGMSM